MGDLKGNKNVKKQRVGSLSFSPLKMVTNLIEIVGLVGEDQMKGRQRREKGPERVGRKG